MKKKSLFGIVLLVFMILFVLQIIYDILINLKISKIKNCNDNNINININININNDNDNDINGKNLIKNLKKSTNLSIAYVCVTILVLLFHYFIIFIGNPNILLYFLIPMCIIGAISLVIMMIYNNYLLIKSRNYMLKNCSKNNKTIISNLLSSVIIRSLLVFVWIILWFYSGFIGF